MWLRALLGVLLGVVARVWLRTLRLRVEIDPALEASVRAPRVFVFFHGTQWPLLAWRGRGPTTVMVSLSSDGAMQARALGLLGFEVVRGSSSRGGVRGLAGVVRWMRRGHDAAFAVDGPRGPYGSVKPGALYAARRAGAVLVPMGSAIGVGRASGMVFRRAWDRFALAWPLARCAVVLGAPIVPSPMSDEGETLRLLGDSIVLANARAHEILRELGRETAQGDTVSMSGRGH